jgi:Ala-tRNA(Pro) deacylase
MLLDSSLTRQGDVYLEAGDRSPDPHEHGAIHELVPHAEVRELC